jgi:hypothetical protein
MFDDSPCLKAGDSSCPHGQPSVKDSPYGAPLAPSAYPPPEEPKKTVLRFIRVDLQGNDNDPLCTIDIDDSPCLKAGDSSCPHGQPSVKDSPFSDYA